MRPKDCIRRAINDVGVGLMIIGFLIMVTAPLVLLFGGMWGLNLLIVIVPCLLAAYVMTIMGIILQCAAIIFFWRL